jgi:pimeloyl-ACP methyl ester carboxylesterase
MKRLVTFILLLSLVSISCKTLNNLGKPSSGSGIEQKLNELDGTPCPDNSDFTCVTINVPLNHFDSANSETIDVVFAIAPAKGERFGMYVQAFPGGPGGEGISYASTYYFPPDILEHYDIVFFDQRGVGLSNPLECKTAYAHYFLGYLNTNDTVGEEGFDTPDEQKTAMDTAKSFVEECIAEMGIDPGKLQYFRTDQVAEDIESFRQAIGDDKFMLYGVSYGTSVAQAYARAHADHLSGLILDGTQDTTQSGDETAFSQWDAFNMVLSKVFEACDANSDCSAGMDGSSQAAYDELEQKLANAPIQYEYPLSNGNTVKRIFAFNMLDYTTSYQLYGLESRTDLMHAIAAAKAGDMVPLANLYYDNANIDPETEEYLGDPNFSDTMYYVVWCSDDAYYSGTPDEREAKLMQEGQKLNGTQPPLDLDVLQLGLTCPFWPSSPSSPENLPPLKAAGVPTMVLNATLDPATPFHEGKSVFENLENGYHIYVNGGLHGIYGRGADCPDQYVNDFLTKGKLPNQREIVCDWGEAVIGQ